MNLGRQWTDRIRLHRRLIIHLDFAVNVGDIVHVHPSSRASDMRLVLMLPLSAVSVPLLLRD